ncbi:MAG: SPW repeat domain-containing protein [Ktedonobacteraceae bacterium]
MNAIRFVPTGVHAYFDYIGGIVLLAAPFIFGFFSMGGPAVIIPMVLGVGLIVYSLLTRYELGIPGLKFIPMPLHLVFDFVAAAFLALSPFLFGFVNKTPNVWLPHLIAGVAVIVLVLVSQTHPQPKHAMADAK